MNDYNVIIMVTEDHLPMMEKMIPFCKQNISPKRIYVVAASKIQQKIEAIEDVIFNSTNIGNCDMLFINTARHNVKTNKLFFLIVIIFYHLG